MTRLGSIFLCATFGFGTALLGCGSSTPSGGAGDAGTGGSGGGGSSGSILDLVPADNGIPGWKVDTDFNTATTGWPADKTKTATAANVQEATDLIDGAAGGFYTSAFAPTAFAWQNYINTTINTPDGYQIKLYILQMPSAAQATALYTSVLDGTHSLYTSNTWADTSASLGDASRITNSVTDWWINFRKGVYYVEVRLTYAESTDLVGKSTTSAFASAVAAKM